MQVIGSGCAALILVNNQVISVGLGRPEPEHSSGLQGLISDEFGHQLLGIVKEL